MLAIGCMVFFLAGSCRQASSVRTVRLAHGLDVTHSVHIAMVRMGDDMARISGGRLRLEIYPNQQLGSEREVLELLQIGTLDMTKVSAATLENFAPKTRILGLPYLFRDREAAFSALDGPIGQELLDDGLEFWLKGLGFYDAGFRSFYAMEKPIRDPADLEGMKVRVMESVTAINMIRSMGGAPTPISWGELYTALQQGVVDAAENNPPSFYLARHYEVCKYYSLDEHTFSPDVLIAGTRFWDALTEQEKGWIREAAANSIAYQRELWALAEADALEKVAAAGVEISRPDKQPFAESSREAYQLYEADTTLARLIREIKELQQ
ncbi:TRAP transporter substrate-binding protein [Robiginitalea sp. SC105]|uniref:TRAP transporter substrate-binding protein n=1 Tax=Robiginitalea sp. SC105 TaxID=2762332 RepID=UPI00163A4204|nr:TRAP transporter substrate-binding protein [Robiginitalea sp. SC105]MBC2838700.1 TRAP transporter substrate-binding protein [Robiginitalea sp. SC105]